MSRIAKELTRVSREVGVEGLVSVHARVRTHADEVPLFTANTAARRSC